MVQTPALDSQFEPFLQALAALPPMAKRSLADIRIVPDRSVFGEPEPVGRLVDLTIPADGAELDARLYAPADASAGLMVYFHGGGWVFGDLETHDLPLRAVVNMTGTAVLSVNYRLAPEHPFPTALNDCYAALIWARDHYDRLIGGRKCLLVGGDSAGGNLAAAVALAARGRKGPTLAGQVLFYPALDGVGDWPSYREHAECALLTHADMRWYWRQYVADERDRSNPLASPLAAEDHRDLPPAILAIAEYDPLRDEARAYAERLRACGNSVASLYFEMLPHGFFNFLSVSDEAKRAVREVAAQVRALIAKAMGMR